MEDPDLVNMAYLRPDHTMNTIKDLIARVDLTALKQILAHDPSLANAGVSLGDQNNALAHPLHRICDGVHAGIYTDEQAYEMAKVFVSFGADVNGVTLVENSDSPLVAAASLSADITAMYYIACGADIAHPGCHGGTALHWAAWCGRDRLVKELIDARAPLEKRCKAYDATPLFWAIHGHKFGGGNRHHQVECAKLLVAAGAVTDTSNGEGMHILGLLDKNDIELRSLLS